MVLVFTGFLSSYFSRLTVKLLSRELGDVDVVSVRIERTNGRADVRKRQCSAHRGCSIRRGQGLGSVLEKREAFDLMLIMAGTNHLAMGVAHCMALHSIQALHVECQMRGVCTVGLRVPWSFFHFRGSELRWPQ